MPIWLMLPCNPVGVRPVVVGIFPVRGVERSPGRGDAGRGVCCGRQAAYGQRMWSMPTSSTTRRTWLVRLGSIRSSQPLWVALLKLVTSICRPVLSMNCRSERSRMTVAWARASYCRRLRRGSATARSSSPESESRTAPRSSRRSCISKLGMGGDSSRLGMMRSRRGRGPRGLPAARDRSLGDR
jgi:hypothetical protein